MFNRVSSSTTFSVNTNLTTISGFTISLYFFYILYNPLTLTMNKKYPTKFFIKLKMGAPFNDNFPKIIALKFSSNRSQYNTGFRIPYKTMFVNVTPSIDLLPITTTLF